jgi:hypothetical protein
MNLSSVEEGKEVLFQVRVVRSASRELDVLAR